jgi:hypothetical protein
MCAMLFTCLFPRILRQGTLYLVTAGGHVERFGASNGATGNEKTPHNPTTPSPIQVAIRLRKWNPFFFFTLRPDLRLARAYADGTLSIEYGSLRDLRYLLFTNDQEARQRPLFKWREALSGSRITKPQSDLIKSTYGFLPEPQFRHARASAHKAGNKVMTGNPLFARTWHKLFHVRSSRGGIQLALPRKRSLISLKLRHAVALSMAQYHAFRNRRVTAAAGRAQHFRFDTIHTGTVHTHDGQFKNSLMIAEPIFHRVQRRAYAPPLRHLAGHLRPARAAVTVPFAHTLTGIHQRPSVGWRDTSGQPVKTTPFRLYAPLGLTPWAQDFIPRWEWTIDAHSDRFVRYENM